MLKAELHSHAYEDKEDRLYYKLKQLIDRAFELKFEVLGVTFHNHIIEGDFFEEHKKYAESKNILLLAGCEATIEKAHVVIYGLTNDERKTIHTLDKLREVKKNLESEGRQILVIAPHPYFKIFGFGASALGKKLEEHADVFDVIEVNMFYLKWFNRNKKGMEFAKYKKIPLVGNGDVHHLSMLGNTYSLIDSKKDEKSVISALKSGKVYVRTKPISLYYAWQLFVYLVFRKREY